MSIRTKSSMFLLVVLFICTTLLLMQVNANAEVPPAQIDQIFPDPNFASVVAEEMGKNVTDIVTLSDLHSINCNFIAIGKNISNIEGI